ncbi:MAG: hypothetical protein V1886_01860 [archaeon]
MKRNAIKPKTRFSDLVEFYKEIKAMENLTFARLLSGVFDEDKSLLFMKEQRKITEERYEKLLNPNDRYSFESLGKLKYFLESCGFDKKQVQTSIEHEKEHYREALIYGFNNGGFACWLVKNKGKLDYVCSTQIAAKTIPGINVYRKISHAPKKPSFIDEMCC